MMWLILGFVLAYAGLAWSNLRWAALLTLALLPTYLVRFEIFGLPTTLLEAQIIILFLVWLIHAIKNGQFIQNSSVSRRIRIQNFPIFGIIFIVTGGLIAIFVGPSILAGIGVFRAFILEPLLFVLVLFETNFYQLKAKSYQLIFWPLGLAAVVLSLFAIVQYLTGQFIDNPAWANVATRRATSFFTYPNGLSLFLTPVVAAFFAWAFLDKEKRIWKLAVAGIGLMGILTTGSKGALLALVMALLVLLVVLFFQKLSLTKKYLTAFGFMAIVISVFYFVPFFKNILAGQSGLIRIDLWRETIIYLNTHWLFGTGWQGLPSALALLHQNPSVEIYSYPHNLFLNFWTTLGLSGLIGLVFILFATFKKFHSLIVLPIFKGEETGGGFRIQILVMLAGLLALLFHGLVDVPFFKNDLAILWWVFILPIFFLNVDKQS